MPSRLPRALIGRFGAITRLGVIAVLVDGAVECVAEPDANRDLLDRLECSQPDVVLIDGDDGCTGLLVAAVRDRRPEVTVITCSNEHLTMRVLPAGPDRRPYETTLSAAELVGAVRAAATR